jgi:Ca2+-binding RTX toxin-like protein
MRPKRLEDDDLQKVVGGAGQDGTPGNDVLQGTEHSDFIYAGDGDDVVTGGGNDAAGGKYMTVGILSTLLPQYYADLLSMELSAGSAEGIDVIHGEAGNDTLDGGTGDRGVDLALGGDGDDTFIWAPGNGSDVFLGEDGHDTLRIAGMTLSELRSALNIEGAPLIMSEGPNGITFIDGNGNPASLSGTISVGGEVLRFTDVERIRLT